MAERPTIGQILMDLGRISSEEVQRALDYQKEHGGYFGEALLTLEIVKRDELEWTLASQFDLPYIFPDADSVDPDAARLVTPEWALSNLAVPIMRTTDALTVVVDSPGRTEVVTGLERMYGLRIDLALASGEKIRELIRVVYARIADPEEGSESAVPVELSDVMMKTVLEGVSRIGVSQRGHRATVWHEDDSGLHRRPLTSNWRDELDRLTLPRPSDRMVVPGSSSWPGEIQYEGVSCPVEVSYLSTPSGTEIVFAPTSEPRRLPDRFPRPPASLIAEIRLLVRSGTPGFLLSTEPAGLSEELLPHVPSLLLNPAWRSVHLQHEGGDREKILAVKVPDSAPALSDTLANLCAFRFDALTASLHGPLESWLHEVMGTATVTFVAARSEGDRQSAVEGGIGWELRVIQGGSGELEWSLLPLRE